MILIAGPPGAGKSIQAQMLAASYGVKWLSMGQLLRDSVDEQVMAIMKQGKLLDDSIVEKVLADSIDKIPLETKILLDGFPRRESQVEWFLNYINHVQRNLKHALHIVVDLDTSIERLKQRGRPDDKIEIITDRYKQYETEIVPMLQHLQHKGVAVHQIDGTASVEEVHQRTVEAIGDFLA